VLSIFKNFLSADLHKQGGFGVLALICACPYLLAADQVLPKPQSFIVKAAETPVMAGDEPLKTLPLGTMVLVSRSQAGWRYSAEEKGWVHVRDLIALDDAIPTFTKEIETRPTTRAYQLRGIAYMALQQWAKAAQDFEKAYDLGESAIAVHLNLGTCYQRMGELPAAIEEYDSILKAYPDDFGANLARGNLLLQQGQFAASLRDLDKAVELDPKSAEAWNARGVVLRMLGRYEEAVSAYSKSLELDPQGADALSNRGYARKQIGDLAAALKDYEAAVQLAPTSAAIRNDLAWFLATADEESLRDGDRAVEISEAICRETDNLDGEYLDTLAAAYARSGRFPAAVEAARLALTVFGDNPGANRTKERLDLYQHQKPYTETVEEKPDAGN